MSGFTYIPKSSKIYTVTLPASGAWTPILTEAQTKAVRGIKIKSRFTWGQSVSKPFDLAFSATPNETGTVTDGTGFISNAGQGLGETFAPTSGIWARAVNSSDTILEVQTYD